MTTAVAADELRQLAERRHRDPAGVVEQAKVLLARGDDPYVTACASLALGLALQELGRVKDAADSYRRCLLASVAHNLTEQEALARAQLAISLLNLGDAVGAEAEIAGARRVAPDSARGVVEMLYGLILQRTGRLDDALIVYRRALRALERAGDARSIARLRLNRGILHGYQGDLAAALDDLHEAERIAADEELPLLAAMAAHNVGFAYGRRAELPDALAAMDRAERAYAALDNERMTAVLQSDRCEVLLAAGLAAEARSAAEAAVHAFGRTGDNAYLTEARLLLARSHLAAGSYEEAAAEAAEAARGFRAARRAPWSALARYVALQAEVLSVQDEQAPPRDLLRRARRIGPDLEAQGWPVEALHVRTFAGRMALALQRPAIARSELAQAEGARRRGTAALRADAWHATALLRLADGDRAGAKRALLCGMRVVDSYRATLGATELRASAANHGADLARLGVGLALADGRPLDLLRWAERWRAGALRRPAVHPPGDEELAADLAELRRLRTERRAGALRGGSGGSRNDRAAVLEERVRRRLLTAKDDGRGHLHGGGGLADSGAETGRIDLAGLRRAVGDRALVEYVAHEGTLYAVTLVGGKARLATLGPVREAEEERRYLLFGLRRVVATVSRTRRQLDAGENALAGTARRLDDLVLAPLGLPDGMPVVVVPTGVLHGVAWSCLPSLAGRPTTVAPSAALWLAGSTRGAHDADRPAGAPARDGVALVAGPGLAGAEAEVRQLARLYRGAEVLTGRRATAANVLAALERARVVHLAAHGSFRADSPLFSSVLLADGQLTVYDLERLRAVPEVVVLPACDAAVSAVRAGDELLGTATALLGLGVRTVIAPVTVVPDEATTSLMLSLHRRLRAGDRPSEALARAAGGRSAFICIGCDGS